MKDNILEKVGETLSAALVTLVVLTVILIGTLMYYIAFDYVPTPMKPQPKVQRFVAPVASDLDKVKNGIHIATGLIAANGFKLVKQQCLGCHSAKLITQNRMNRATWKETIEWMQATQGLWDLGQNEAPILDYLAINYAPKKVGRRQNLEVAEWYLLD